MVFCRAGEEGARRSEGEGPRRSAGASLGGRFTPRYVVGKYSVDLESFERVALPPLQWKSSSREEKKMKSIERPSDERPHEDDGREIKAESDCEIREGRGQGGGGGREGGFVVVVDEIGKMELFSHKFVDQVRILFDGSESSHSLGGREGGGGGGGGTGRGRVGGAVVLATIPVVRAHGKEHRLLQNLRQRQDCRLFQVKLSA